MLVAMVMRLRYGALHPAGGLQRAGDKAGQRQAAPVWSAHAQPGRGYVLWAMDYFLGKIFER